MLSLLSSLLLLACGDSELTMVTQDVEAELLALAGAQIHLVSGDEQEGEVGSILPARIIVEVVDADAAPLAGAPVKWTFTHGAGVQVGQGQPASNVLATTDAAGRASIEWQLGTSAGMQQASAEIVLPSTAPPVAGGPSLAPNNDHGRKIGLQARAKPGSAQSVSVSPDAPTLSEGDSIHLDADVSDRYGNLLEGASILWRSDDETVVQTTQAGLVHVVGTGSTAVIAESGRAEGSAIVTVAAVGNQAPTAAIESPSQDTTVTQGDAVDFQGSASDTDGAVMSHSWAFGDGTTSSVEGPGAHTYTAVGSYNVTYQVTDDQGAPSAVASLTVTVTRAAVEGAIFSDGFESGDFSGTVGGRWYNQVAATVSAAQARTGNYSLQFFYPGKPNPDADGWSEIRGSIEPNDAPEIWMEWYVLVPSNYAYRGAGSDGGGNNKWWAFSFGGAAADKLHGGQCPTPGGWAVRTEFQGSAVGINRARNTYVVSPLCGLNETAIQQHHSSRLTGDHGPYLDQPDAMVVAADRGTWVQFRVHLKLSSANVTIMDPDTIGAPGYASFPTALYQGDGVYEYWKNGTRVMQTRNLPLGEPGTAGVPINVFELMGWANTGFTQDTYFYIDDVKIYSSDPGW